VPRRASTGSGWNSIPIVDSSLASLGRGFAIDRAVLDLAVVHLCVPASGNVAARQIFFSAFLVSCSRKSALGAELTPTAAHHRHRALVRRARSFRSRGPRPVPAISSRVLAPFRVQRRARAPQHPSTFSERRDGPSPPGRDSTASHSRRILEPDFEFGLALDTRVADHLDSDRPKMGGFGPSVQPLRSGGPCGGTGTRAAAPGDIRDRPSAKHQASSVPPSATMRPHGSSPENGHSVSRTFRAGPCAADKT